VERGGEVGVGALEAVERGQVNSVRGGAAEGALGLVVADVCAGGLSNAFKSASNSYSV
jgi:hypothetical protein